MASSIGDARTRRVGAVAAFVAATVAVAWVDAAADTPPVSAEVLKERREVAINLGERGADETVASVRAGCVAGSWVNTVRTQRARGRAETSDASDTCPVAFGRSAKDGVLMAFYAKLVSELAGDVAMAPTLPAAIGAAVTKGGSDVVAIGNQRGAKITPALALDAGFTVAYQKGAKHGEGMPDLATLKPIAERCLAQGESNLALCYSTGYVYGARAISQLPLVP